MNWYSDGPSSGGLYPAGYVRNAPISTFPVEHVRTGSTTIARKGSWYCWLSICVLQSMPDIQQP